MCSIISWDEKYSIGVPRIDEQHQQFFKYLNEYYYSLAKGTANKMIDKTLNELIEYADFHFKDEENFMVLIPNYDFEKHKKEHNNFLLQVQKLLKSNKQKINYELFNFMKEWIINHILITDKKMLFVK